jgi:hypothetical protein
MVLGGCADHCRTADIDILDTILIGGVLRDGLLERVEVHDEQIDLRNSVILHRLGVFGIVADREQAAMDLGMQRLDPAIHHFREAGEVGHVGDLQARRSDRLGGTAGGDEVDAVSGQRAREFDQPGLIGNGQ